MWRLANCIYRVFPNAATHCYSQHILFPTVTLCCKDEELDKCRDEKRSVVKKIDIQQVLKVNQYPFKNIEKIQDFLTKFAIQQFTRRKDEIKSVEPVQPKHIVQKVQSIPDPPKKEEAVNSIREVDESSQKNLNDLHNLHEETISIINLQTALDALESGNLQLGIKTLQDVAKSGTNAAALYNLGICYEHGIGVEQDRAKACDYYRQASTLGHADAQFNLTILSNNVDADENDDELKEESVAKKPSRSLFNGFIRFAVANNYKEDHSSSDKQFDLRSLAVACLT